MTKILSQNTAAYVRVSTADQGIEHQRESILSEYDEDTVNWFVDIELGHHSLVTNTTTYASPVQTAVPPRLHYPNESHQLATHIEPLGPQTLFY